MCGQIANLADLAAWAAFDAGQSAPSRSTFGLGIRAAQEAGDDGLLCHVATGLARQEIAERRSKDAVALADRAMDNVPLSALSMIAAVKAQAYAIQGDETEVMRQIALAESIYSRVTDLRSEPRWMWYFTEHKLHGETGHALYLLALVKDRPVSDLVSRLRRAVDSQTSNRARATSAGPALLVFHTVAASALPKRRRKSLPCGIPGSPTAAPNISSGSPLLLCRKSAQPTSCTAPSPLRLPPKRRRRPIAWWGVGG